MSLTINNTFMDGVSSGDKVQSVTQAATVKPVTRVVICTGNSYKLTLPAAAEMPGVFLAIINKAAGTVTCEESAAGMITLASDEITTGTVALLYSSGVAWHAVAGLS